jgi:dinuclear metal center YbgI/SA1388 family protein
MKERKTNEVFATELGDYLDNLLSTSLTPDYPNALNGMQLENEGPIQKLAAAVDFSQKTIAGAVAANANMLLVHHGMFWGSPEKFVGASYKRLRVLLDSDVAVYASHLPLDRHSKFGNNVLLAKELGLNPTGEFAQYQGIAIGVSGEATLFTQELFGRAKRFAAKHSGNAVATAFQVKRKTKRWAICTGAGASAKTLAEATAAGIDTLVVGEGPHWTSIAAEESDLVIIYAGHYATETLGVQALARHVSETFGIGWEFIAAPTGL